MTRKDYELIAAAIAGMPTHAPALRTTQDSAARTLADALARTNPRFNRARFLEACKVAA